MFLDSLKLMTSSPKMSILLYNSLKDYKKIEDIFEEKLKDYSFFNDFKFNNKDYNELKYFEKNFFSIFFISIFKTLNFTKEEINKYGLIFHMIRIIVTCTDNILDAEEKGPVFLNTKANSIIKNILIMLISSEIMNTQNSNKNNITLMETLYKIAYGESSAKVTNYSNYPSIEFITKEIHQNIGGELLAIAFDALLIEKKDNSDIINNYREAIIHIGLALQALDDMTDIEEDLAEDKSNLLVSIILSNNITSYEDLKNENDYLNLFKNDYIILIKRAMNYAFKGFKMMEDSGYPINRSQAHNILKIMFKLRGLEKEWLLYEESIA